MDGARVFRRRAGARTPHVEHEDRVAGAVHARNRAAGERMTGDQALVSFGRSGGLAPAPAGRPVDRPRAEPRHGVAQLVIDDRRGGGARGGFCCVRGNRRGAALLLERRQRALPEGDLVDASPAEMRVHPSHDHGGAVLRLERESALDPEHQGCGNTRRLGVAFGGARRPLQLDRPGVTRKRFADNGWPSRRSGLFRPGRARPAPRRSARA